MIGSEFDRRTPSRSGNSSEMRWFNRNPVVASGASASKAQAPLRLPMAFQVQTVFSFSAAICATGTTMVPAREETRAQSPSANPCASQIFVGRYR